MPTIDARVAASADDGNELSNGNVQTTGSPFNVDGTGEWMWFRVNVTIPDGATIDAAYLQLNFDSGTADEPDLTIYGEDTATPAAAVAGTGTFSLSSRSRTTASVNWSSTDLGAPGAFNSPSIVPIIEELMASYSYASGAYMAFLWTSRAGDASRDAQVIMYDALTTQGPLLHIEYTEAGGGGTEYTQSASGTLTSAGAVAKSTSKSAAGTLTSAGALIKQTAKSLAGTAVDPTGVFAKYRDPSGNVDTLEYGVDAELVKDSTGNYHVDIPADEAGWFIYYFYSTGTGAAASLTDKFHVDALPF